MKKNSIIINLFLFLALAAAPASAFTYQDDFPKLANYYLQPIVPDEDFERLSKYDLLVLDADVENARPDILNSIKARNPQTNILSYIPSQSVNIRDMDYWSKFRQSVYDEAQANDRWLKDSDGSHIYFSNDWPFLRFIDIGNGWSDYMSGLAARSISENPAWDGVFYDMVFANLSWLNNGDIDLDRDGSRDESAAVNNYWLDNSNKLIIKTRQKTNKPVVSNVDIPDKFRNVGDGMMMENFPAGWLGPTGWSKLENNYVKSTVDGQKKINIINANISNRSYAPDLYKKMRFGLASTLMGDGYYSFDYGDQDHAQTWWYDEYDVSLGKAETGPSNLLNKSNSNLEAGLWRRDFERGVALVNSTDKIQTYVFRKEEFEKINGKQDRSVNNGIKINWIKVPPKDGIVLLRINNKIENSGFNNGSFVRVFDDKGTQTRNGFFSYADGFPGDTQVLYSDINNDQSLETLVNGHGEISIYSRGKKINSFKPYGKDYNKLVSFAVADLDNDGRQEIITGPGPGGGPQIRIFSTAGKLLSGGFFAYDKKFRGGVNIAVADLDNDGRQEIITGPGPGGGPQIRIFSTTGKIINQGVMAYDKNFRGGVSVAAGDINNDGRQEIITGPFSHGGPQIKIFDSNLKNSGQFFAYDKSLKTGIRVMTDDINKDGKIEILASTNNFTN